MRYYIATAKDVNEFCKRAKDWSRIVMVKEVRRIGMEGSRGGGRQKKKWEDVIMGDMREC